MDTKYYESIDGKGLMCEKCKCELVKTPVQLCYSNTEFPVELPSCPKCGFTYVPEELAVGRIRSVEKSLEDK